MFGLVCLVAAMIRIRTAEDLSRAVRERRRALGLTQKQLALAAGLGRVSVLRLENEPEKTQLRTALRAADVLRLDLSITALAAETAGEGRGEPGYGALPFEGLDG